MTVNLQAAKQAETAKTGKELDISRKSPYAGLTMGEKGSYCSNYDKRHLLTTELDCSKNLKGTINKFIGQHG